MSTFTLELPTSQEQDTASWAAVAFIASYSSEATRRTYTTQLRLWLGWCANHHLDPLGDIRRPHVALYARELEARGLAAATVALKLVVVTGFYRYCTEEKLLEHSPAVHVRRPKVSQESTRIGLDRNELGAFLVQAGLSGGPDPPLRPCPGRAGPQPDLHRGHLRRWSHRRPLKHPAWTSPPTLAATCSCPETAREPWLWARARATEAPHNAPACRAVA